MGETGAVGGGQKEEQGQSIEGRWESRGSRQGANMLVMAHWRGKGYRKKGRVGEIIT